MGFDQIHCLNTLSAFYQKSTAFFKNIQASMNFCGDCSPLRRETQVPQLVEIRQRGLFDPRNK